ncbi:MAG: hypothetical protein GWP08_07740 [Nitrospiraceae bacterium]|nr:hypothetical protein [Nitrospiraceae bacterium]
MKAYRHIGLPVLLSLIVVAAAGCPDGVFFADKALESAIRAELHQPFGILTQQDLLEVRSIDARGLGIRDMSGIEYCKNLAWLDLDTNKISNLKPLEQLGRPESPFDSPLSYLNLDANEITDITPLAGLLNLTGLSLFDNQIADIQALVTNAENGGLGPGDSVVLDASTLNDRAVNVDIPTLQAFGVNVTAAVPTDSTEG